MLAQFSLLPQTDRLIRTTPTSYEDCILKNLCNTSSDVAAQAIIEACQAKFNTEAPIVSRQGKVLEETTLSKKDLGRLTGKLGWMDGEGVQVWVVNRTERWVLEQVTLGIEYWNPEAAGVVSVQLVSPPLEGVARIPPGYGMWVHFQGVSPHALIHLERWWFEAASGFQRRDTPTLAEQAEQARQEGTETHDSVRPPLVILAGSSAASKSSELRLHISRATSLSARFSPKAFLAIFAARS